jgi:ankyrin repeat protein
MEAASTGNFSLLERMLDMGVDVNVQAEDGYTALHCAAKTGQLAIISFLLTKGAAIDPRNTKIQARRPIHEAISARHVEAIAMLLHAGADILLSDAKNQTVIDYIGLVGDLQATQTLFSEERKQIRAPEMASRLAVACVKSGNHSSLRWLLSRYPSAIPQPKNLADSPIYVATRRRHDEVVAVLLSSSDLSSQSTPAFVRSISGSLVWAASHGCAGLVKRFLMCDTIDPNKTDTELGNSALHYAALQGNEQIIKLLLSHSRIDVNNKDRSANTPLYISAEKKGHQNVLKPLLHHKDIDLHSKNRKGHTPLDEAFFNYKWNALRLIADHQNLTADLGPKFPVENLPNAHPDQDRLLVSLLLDRGLLSTKSDDYRGLLKKVITAGALEVVKVLVDRLSLDINAFLDRSYGHTALHVAAQHHRHDIFQFYLEDSRVDVNTIGHGFGKGSVLHHSIEHNCMTAVKLLLARPEINLTLRNYMRNTALDVARECGKREMFELLLSHGAVGESLEMDPTIVDKHADEQSCWEDQDEDQLQRRNAQSSIVEMEDSDIGSDREEDEEVDMSF